ncbi:enoyl-CoA hydratase/isomerase family protein [Streptomyces sp. S465]|uniref:enoyl-CoA hydratase/isomerase family protein n=1 Tax=Streptomyces sp. S465 TaxID=2979468 RepID=UPI0022A8B875|nr:enoyl-CoA hydratase/isomerase family protein [Streptomyces sp. S465]WAP54869.1 enoyl-CoA hydratase/isomerase family protein [Streptomyces sp. S465]
MADSPARNATSPGPPIPPSVSVTMRDGIAVLLLNRPDYGNAMNTALLEELLAATEVLARDPALRGVLMSGAGKAFSLGGDIREFHQALSDDTFDATAYGDRLTHLLKRTVLAIRALPCPVLAAVNGQAAGAGFSLALACDLRLASRRASFHFAYGAIGASTDAGMAWFLPRAVGYARALELLLEQPVIRAPQALREGLVSAVVDPDELVEAGLRRLRELAQAAPHTIRSAKRLLDRSLSLPLADHLELERADFATGVASRDMRHGIASLLTGEWPEFRGE